MRAVVYDRYGPPEVLRLEEVEPPVPADDEVLVRVRATTVNRTDSHMRRASPFIWRFMLGLRRPKRRILGLEFAGEVDAVGAAVTEFRVGDRVFGMRSGSHAEYVCVREAGVIAHIPSGTTFEEAAAVCDGATQALAPSSEQVSARARASRVRRSGSCGTAAVQLAKRHLGAHVTAVCNTKNVELVRSLGADEVVDYLQEDFTRNGETYDVVPRCRRQALVPPRQALAEAGRPLPRDRRAPQLPLAYLTSWVGDRKVVFAIARPTKEDVLLLRGLVEAGTYRPVIDSVRPVEEAVEAHRYVDAFQKTGNVVLTVNGGRLDEGRLSRTGTARRRRSSRSGTSRSPSRRGRGTRTGGRGLVEHGGLVRGRGQAVRRPPSMGLRGPKSERLGTDYAGTVEAVGPNVTEFEPGDEVFGGRTGAFAEYVARDRPIVPKPAGVTFEEAAAVPVAALTALQGLRDTESRPAGQHVLVNGASGGVGTYAVRIAKALGGEVTAVQPPECRHRAVDRRRSRRRLHAGGLHPRRPPLRPAARRRRKPLVVGVQRARHGRRSSSSEAEGGRLFGPSAAWSRSVSAARSAAARSSSSSPSSTSRTWRCSESSPRVREMQSVIDRRVRAPRDRRRTGLPGGGHARGKIIVAVGAQPTRLAGERVKVRACSTSLPLHGWYCWSSARTVSSWIRAQ